MAETAQPVERSEASDEALVITAADGTAYAIPLNVLTQWRLSDAVAAQLREQQEVSGYIIVIGGYQALAVSQLSLLVGDRLTPAQVAACFPPIGTKSVLG